MSDLLWEGLNLALFGMGFVFIFLIVLVFLTGAMSSLVRQFSPLTVGVDGSNQTSNRQSDRKAKKRQGSDSQLGTDENNEVVAAVTAAVRLHHSKR